MEEKQLFWGWEIGRDKREFSFPVFFFVRLVVVFFYLYLLVFPSNGKGKRGYVLQKVLKYQNVVLRSF